MEVKRFLPVLFLIATPQLHAQAGAGEKPWFVSVSHYGKWVALAGAAGLLSEAALRHGEADRQYGDLVGVCRSTPARCEKGADGSYLDAQTEALYQRTVDLDHRARGWLVGAEFSILTAGTMFVLDLVYHDDGPKNIPYSPFSVYAQRGGLGLTVRF